MGTPRHVSLFLIVLAVAATVAAQDLGLGLVSVRNQLPFDQLFLALTPEGVGTLADGGLRVSLSATWSNTFIMSPEIHDWVRHNRPPGRHSLTSAGAYAIVAAHPDADLFLFDGELVRWTLRTSYGLTDALQLTVDVPVLSRGGGFADSAIESFHSSLGIGNADRELFPQNHFQVFMRFGGHQLYLDGAPANNVIGDVSVELKLRARNRWHGWSAAASVAAKAPTGRAASFGGSGNWDGQVAGYASRSLGPGRLHLNLAFTALGGVENMPGFSVDDLWTAVAGYEIWSSHHAVNWIAQATWATSVCRSATGSDLSDPAYLLLVGARVPARAHGTLTFAIIENIVQFDNSADLALHIGYAHTFGGR